MMFFNKQKTYFKKKLQGVQNMIWDLEFKRAKTQMIREEIRQDYDQLKSKLYVLEGDIKKQAETPTMEKGEIARLDDQKVLLDRDIKRREEQMKDLDLEVMGSKATNEYPEGVQGVNQQIDALHELKSMLKEYIATL